MPRFLTLRDYERLNVLFVKSLNFGITYYVAMDIVLEFSRET